jgi:hypothetical protein
MSNKIAVANIYHDAKDEEILEYLQIAGPILKYEVKRDGHKVQGNFTYIDHDCA